MPWNNAMMVIAANAIRGAATHLQLHSGDPGASGTSNVTTAARQAVTWSAATADGDFGLSATVNFSGAGNAVAATYVSAWSSAGSGSPPTGGTWYGNFQLAGDLVTNAAGDYALTALDINGSAT